MIRWTFPIAMLMLAACSGGEDEQTSAPDEAASAPTVREDARAPEPSGADTDTMARWREDRGYEPDASEKPPAVPDPGIGTGDKVIPPAIRGRWALNAADCEARKGTDLTALVIDAKTLRFFESAGDLARVRERSATRLTADYKFSGEGMEWDRLMLLTVEDDGKTLVRRDYGEGAAPESMRYSRCS